MLHKKISYNNELYFWLALSIAYVVAFVNGARLPTLWSINYYLPSFFDGIFRRSLAGSILSFLGDYKYHYWTIATIQILLLSFLNYIIVRRIKDQKILRWFFVLFLLAPTGGFMFHIVGYIDYVLYLVLFLSISLKNKWIANSIIILSLFFHEMALLTIIPLYLAYRIYQKEDLKKVIGFGLFSLLTFLIISVFIKVVPAETVASFVAKLQQKGDFNIRYDYYELFGITYYKIWYTKEYLFQVLLISPIYIVCYLLQTKNIILKDKFSQLIVCSISIFACVAPLLLGLSGYDINRWVFLSILNSMFILSLFPTQIYQYQKILFAVMILYISIGYLHYFDKKHPRLQNIDDIEIFLPDLKDSLFNKPKKY
ncbi:hypothetical protein [Chryseobacterium sp. T1]